MDLIYSVFGCCFKKQSKATENKVDERAAEKLIEKAIDVSYENVTGDLRLTGKPGEELATFGAGCYWGTEKYIVSKLGA